MKKTKAKSVPAVVEQGSPMIAGATAVPFRTAASITAEFIAEKRKGQKRDGANSYVDDLELALNMIVNNYQDKTWDVNTALELTRFLDTPASALVPAFLEWTQKLKDEKRINQCLSISSFPSWVFV